MRTRPATFIYLFAILLAAAYGQSQSLGERARAEKEKKDAKGADTTARKVFTNDDMKPAPSGPTAAVGSKGNPYTGRPKKDLEKVAADLEIRLAYAQKLAREGVNEREKASGQRAVEAARAELEKVHQAAPDVAIDTQGGSIEEKSRKLFSLMSDQERRETVPKIEELVAQLGKLLDACVADKNPQTPCDSLASYLRDAKGQLEMLQKMTR
jgi:hypothetical protein